VYGCTLEASRAWLDHDDRTAIEWSNARLKELPHQDLEIGPQ